MITLTRKKKDASNSAAESSARISIREYLLVKEVQELDQNLPNTCMITFQDPNVLYEFILFITPNEGFWQGGRFKFAVYVPEEYNMAVSCGSPRNSLRFHRTFLFAATEGEMHDKTLAPQYIRRRGHLPIAAPAELNRWPRLGSNSATEGCHMGLEFSVYG